MQRTARQETSTRRETEEVETTTAKAVGETAVKAESEATDLDALLDSIDDLLEENAEQFVENFVQRGGQ
ncbi:MAG: ubiquitin-like protein Pup [Candidatus Saccharimonadales bacterium]